MPTVPATKPLFPLMAEALIRGYMAPRIAQDAVLDLKPALLSLSLPFDKAAQTKFKLAFDAALKVPAGGKPILAMDADVADFQDVLEELSAMAPEIADLVVGGGAPVDPNAAQPGAGKPPVPGAAADTPPNPAPAGNPASGVEEKNNDAGEGDALSKVTTFLTGKLSPEDMATVTAMLKSPPVAQDGFVSKVAMDAALAAVTDSTVKRVREESKAVREAERAVLPFVGPLSVAMDSADEVYKFALTKLGVKLDGVHASAFPAILAAQQRRSAARPGVVPVIAGDSAEEPPKEATYEERYGFALPGAKK